MTVRPEHLGADGTVQSGVYAAMAESLASTGTAVEVVPQGLIPSGLSNATHVVGDARDGVLEAVARCRARGELEWLWDVEIGPPGGAPTALATVAIAVRRARREKCLTHGNPGSGDGVPHAAWSFSAARETPMQARRAVLDWARRHVEDRAVLSDIALAITEAATNVVLHAYRDRDVARSGDRSTPSASTTTSASPCATRAPAWPRASTARASGSGSG